MNPEEEGQEPQEPPGFVFPVLSMAGLRAEVAKRGERRWLARDLWPERQYGVLAAEMKVGKTWGEFDFAVSVASGTPWLGMFPVEVQGPVLIYLGEGGHEGTLQHLEAVARSKGLALDDLPIRITLRSPKLMKPDHLEAVTWELAQEPRPVLVCLDPLYLSASGVQSSQLNDVGEALERLQHRCEEAKAALMVVHHWNRKDGSGNRRMSGAGPAEWGRVLLNLSAEGPTVEDRDPEGHRRFTRPLLLEADGGEVAPQSYRFTRRITRLGDKLGSPLRYEILQAATEAPRQSGPRDHSLQARLIQVLRRAEGEALTTSEVMARLQAMAGRSYAASSVRDALAKLRDATSPAIVRVPTPPGEEALWRSIQDGEVAPQQTEMEWPEPDE